MKAILQLRITKWYFKLLYIVIASLIGLGIHRALLAIGGADLLVAIFDLPVTLAQYLLGARLFRGRGEPIDPPRAWWRMTARAPLSWVIGIVAILGTIDVPLTFIRAAGGNAHAIAQIGTTVIADFISNGLSIAIVAFLYLNSAIRLRKLPKPEREQGFPAHVDVK